MKNVLKFLGKLGKGGATIAGAVLGVGGIAAGGGDMLANCIGELLKQPDSAITTAGIVLFLLGFGRKAGYITAKEESKG